MSNVEHKKYCASFYVYVPRLNNKLRLFKIFPVEFDEIQEKDGQNFLIQFDLSNIYLYALDKVHIAEVVASSWPEDFIDFVDFIDESIITYESEKRVIDINAFMKTRNSSKQLKKN